MTTTNGWSGWAMTRPGHALERVTRPLDEPRAGQAVIEVAGCGVCHTDLSFLRQGVKTRRAPPLVLGHEISGRIAALGDGVVGLAIGQAVIVPAVLPCGECDLCRAGRRTICRRQLMPGNDCDGGFASHLTVPARFLCPVPPALLAQHELWQLAVVSDAIATPFQAVRRAEVAPGDLAIVVGSGGIGIHAVQIAAAAGATVVALDVHPAKLEQAERAGASAVLDVRGVAVKEVRQQVRQRAETLGARAHGWKIFETSGTRAGQETAWALLGYGATLAVVGFTADKVEICLSHLMAYDAVARGNWGADPLMYPELLEWIGAGRIAVAPFVARHPLDSINDVLDMAHHGALVRRAVLVPD